MVREKKATDLVVPGCFVALLGSERLDGTRSAVLCWSSTHVTGEMRSV